MYFVATTLKLAGLGYYRIQWENVQVSHDFLLALYIVIYCRTVYIQAIRNFSNQIHKQSSAFLARGTEAFDRTAARSSVQNSQLLTTHIQQTGGLQCPTMLRERERDHLLYEDK